jgi:translocation and assembly module TamB
MFTTSVRGSEKEAYFEPLRLSSADGVAEFEGNVAFDTFFPSGVLTLSEVETGNGEKVNGKLAIDRLPTGVDIHGSHLGLGELSFDAFRLTLAPAVGGAAFTLSTSFAGSGPEDLLQASGDLHFGRPAAKVVTPAEVAGALSAPAVSVSATLKNVPPAKLYHLLIGAGRMSLEQQDIYNLLGHYSISTEAVVSTDFSHLSLSARTVTVASTDDPATGFHFGISVDKSHLSLTGFTGAWKGVTIHGGFDGDLGEGGQIGFASNVSFLGTSYFFTGRYSESAGLTASGSYGLAVSALPIRGGGALVKLHGVRFPIPLEGAPVPVSFDVSGLVTPEGEWSADFPSITIHDVQLPQAPHSVIQVGGRLTPRVLELTQLSVTNGSTTLAGTARADIVLPSDIFDPLFLSVVSVQGTGSVRTADGLERYSVKGGLARGILALAVQFDGAPLQRLGINGVQGTLSCNGTVNGPVDQLTADMVLSLKQGKLGTDTLAADGRLLVGPDGFQVRSLSAAYLAHRLTGGEGSLDLRKGAFGFKGQFQTEVFTDTIVVALGLSGSYSPSTGAPLAVSVFDLGLQGKLSLNGIKVAGNELPSWAVAFRTTAGKISFDGGPGNSMHGWIDPQLAFSASLQDPLPLTGNVQGRITRDRIHAAFDVESFDLLVLNSILKSPPLNTGSGPIPVVHFTAGVGSGRLVVDGEVNDPDFTGQIDLVGGGLLSAYSPDEAGPIRTSLIFDGKGFHIPKTVAAAGSSRLSAEASFAIDHWIPMTWDIAIATESGTSVRLRARYGRLNVQGAATGAIRVSGDDRKTNVGGSLVVSDCRITLGPAAEVAFVPEESPTYVNLTIQTGRRVEFHWPSEDVPVIRTTATPGGTIAVTYRGDTGAYTVKGGTGVQGGEIYYFDRTFIMKKGSITFNEDQANFDPWITARAEVREWDPTTGTEVRIYLDADSPFSKFSPRFSSDPPRAGTDILAMIGAPLVNRVETQGIGMAALVYSDILSQNLILRPFEQKVRQVLNLDMFSVRTQLIQNLVAQKVLGTAVNPLDNTSVSLGKYLGNDLFLEMLVRLQQPQVPVAVIAPGGGLIAASMALQPDLELNLEWATPFFLMEWSFLPKHPESLFLSDNSLSFSWSFSY